MDNDLPMTKANDDLNLQTNLASQLQAMRKVLEEIKSWKCDTLSERPRKDTEYRDPKADEAFDRGTRMAFFRCADRADEALRSLTKGAEKK